MSNDELADPCPICAALHQCEHKAAAELVSGTGEIDGIDEGGSLPRPRDGDEPDDELGARRTERSDDAIAEDAGAAAATSLMDGLVGQERVADFVVWARGNLPQDEFGDGALGMAGQIVGAIIAAWLEAGAETDVIKEYFTRTIDIAAAQFVGARRAIDEYVEKMWICDGCGFPNPRDSASCAKCEKVSPHA